jgi:uncharacterized protein (TIGR02186 family)
MRRALAALLLLAAALPARAEELVILLSTQDVAITSTYTGARVTVFGAIERDFASVSRPSKYDVVISVAGPSAPILVRHKEPLGPLWINRNLMRYADVPGYYALLTTGPVLTIANEAARERGRMGLTYMLPPLQPDLPDELNPDKTARDALFRLLKKQNLLVEDVRAVQMPRPNLFSAAIPLSANAPTGRYVVTVTVLSEGVPLKTSSTSFVVRKIGFEAYMAAYARDSGLIYGVVTAGLAILIGILGNLIFRRD